MMRYRVELTPDDNGTLIVTCPDLPLVLTFGDDLDDAKRHAVDAIETAIASMIDDREDIPIPIGIDDEGEFVRLPVQTELKVKLYRALREAGLSRAGLQHRLGWKRESVDRLFRVDHNSRINQLEAAFCALEQDIHIEVRPAGRRKPATGQCGHAWTAASRAADSGGDHAARSRRSPVRRTRSRQPA